jgi:hypothetical protein
MVVMTNFLLFLILVALVAPGLLNAVSNAMLFGITYALFYGFWVVLIGGTVLYVIMNLTAEGALVAAMAAAPFAFLAAKDAYWAKRGVKRERTPVSCFVGGPYR